MVTKVTKYETSDGTMFDDVIQASRYENTCNARETLLDQLAEYSVHGGIEVGYLFDVLNENKNLAKAFCDYLERITK